MNVQVVDGDRNGSACGFLAIPEYPDLLGSSQSLAFSFPPQILLYAQTTNLPQTISPAPLGIWVPGILTTVACQATSSSGSSLALAVGFSQGIPKG